MKRSIALCITTAYLGREKKTRREIETSSGIQQIELRSVCGGKATVIFCSLLLPPSFLFVFLSDCAFILRGNWPEVEVCSKSERQWQRKESISRLDSGDGNACPRFQTLPISAHSPFSLQCWGVTLKKIISYNRNAFLFLSTKFILMWNIWVDDHCPLTGVIVWSVRKGLFTGRRSLTVS